MFAGYLLFHPYTMLVYALMHMHSKEELHLHWRESSADAIASFEPMMLPMAISFAVFGGVIGLLIGILIDRKKRLDVAEHETEKKKIALGTMNKLMVTLSHYLLNANMIIGGKVRHCRKATSNDDILDALMHIEGQARKIDAVVAALRKLTEIKTAHYTASGQTTMIDIAQEIEEQLKRAKGKQ